MDRTIGIIMTVIGIGMLIWTGFTYTRKEKVIDAGPHTGVRRQAKISQLATLCRWDPGYWRNYCDGNR